MYVRTGGGSVTTIDFDDLKVDASDYLIPAGRYVRSPHFVVLPRMPDVAQDQGNWVGAQSTMVSDGEFLMWYRMRDNKERGRGYGFARSSDGLNWEKYENNPLFTHDPEFSSNEKICVLKVDGTHGITIFPAGYFTGERVVLAGKYEGIYPGVATRVMPDGTSYYEAFPFMVPKAEGLSFAAMRLLRVVVYQWDRTGKTIATGTLEDLSGLPRQAQVQLKAEKLVPGTGYRLMINGDLIVEATADKYGKILFTFTIERRRDVEFKILRN